MRTILAIICFLATIIHGLFGYYIHFKGESLFEPEGMIVAVEKKAPSGAVSYDVFRAVNPNAVEEAKVQEAVKSPTVTSQSPESKAVESTASGDEAQKPKETTPPVVASAPKAELAATTPAKEDPWWKRMLQKKDNSQLVKQGEVNQDENGKFVPANSNKEGAKEIIGFKTGWIGFLQVENAMVGLIAFILGIAVCCVKGKGKTSRWVFFCNLLFWTGLTGLLVLFEPVNTPLSMVKVGYAYPQWILISGMTGLGAILSLLLILFSFGGQKEVQVVKKVIVEEHTKKVESAPQPETKPVSEKQSFFKRMFKGKSEPKAPEIQKAPVMKKVEEVQDTETAKEVVQKSQVKEQPMEASRFNASKYASTSESNTTKQATKMKVPAKASDFANTESKVAKPQDAIQEKVVEKKNSFEGTSAPQKEVKELAEQKKKSEEKSVTTVPEASLVSKEAGKVSQKKENSSLAKEEELPAVIIPPAPVKESKEENTKESDKGNTQNKD